MFVSGGADRAIEGAGRLAVRPPDQGLSFVGVVLEGGCRLEIDQHEPQILRAGDFIPDPGGVPLLANQPDPASFAALETI